MGATYATWANAPLLLLSSKNKEDFSIFPDASLIFIDSIHHFSLKKRLQFYRQQKAIILTAHHSKKIEYWLAGKTSQTIYFSGIDEDKLAQILNNRIYLALQQDSPKNFQLNVSYIQKLIAYFGDDYRGILNFLYDEFRKNNDYEQSLY